MATDAERLSSLARERHISLTTFKRDGTAVATPVWVVSDDGRRLLVWSGAQTWKVKRIRRDPNVRVTPCDAKGKVQGDSIDGTARLLGPTAGPLVQELLRKKYGLLKRALDAFNGFVRLLARRPKVDAEYIEILPHS